MKKVIIVPDSFKGTMSSMEICNIMKTAILKHYPDSAVISIPVADGGEGSVDAFLAAMGGQKISVTVKGPYFKDMTASYGIINRDTAVIETASCAGLPLIGEDKRPDETTTYGVGQLMLHAAAQGCKQIIVGLGGSSTNDLGTGAAAAAGVRFYDKAGNSFLPTGGTLSQITAIDTSGINSVLKGVEITAMCDIDNPLYGPHGAAYMFAPQKGADDALVQVLDQGLRDAASIIERDLKVNISCLQGAGAAGGFGGGMAAFFHAGLRMGIEAVLDTVKFDEIARDADLIISGEGKLDTQSLRGKVVIGVARRAKALGVPMIAVVGDIGDDVSQAYEEGVSGIFSINRVAVDFKESKLRCKNDLQLTVENLMYFLNRIGF